MSRKTRREQKQVRSNHSYWNDITDYVSKTECSIANLTEDTIYDIVVFIVYYMKTIKGTSNVEDVHVINHMTSLETFKEFGEYHKGCINGDCEGCKVTEWMTKLYSKVNERFVDSSIKLEDLGAHLTILSIEAMKKGFESLSLYVKFLIMTIYQENGKFHTVSEDEQNRVKTWVHLQQKFQVKWNIFIKIPLSESRRAWMRERQWKQSPIDSQSQQSEHHAKGSGTGNK